MTDPQELQESLGLRFTPTPQQAEVISYPLFADGCAQPLLVVAGAGSGKTETMSVRGAHLIATKQVSPEQILGLTFTRKAAAELAEKLAEKGRAQSSDTRFGSIPVATTYNSFALSVVREFGPLIGIPPNTTHMDPAAAWQLMHDIVVSWSGELPDAAISTVTDAALSLRDEMAGQGMDSDWAARNLLQLQSKFDAVEVAAEKPLAFMNEGSLANQERLQLLEVVKAFEERKQELGRTDFADQVVLATQIVSTSPHARNALRERHRVVFLDEFQDTSVSQMEFLSTLFGDHPVTAVGDPNQAIYGWRGASAASLEDFHQMFSTLPGTRKAVLNLSTSWRNSRLILDVANKIATPLRSGADDEAPLTVPSPQLLPADGSAVGTVKIAYSQFQQQQVENVVAFVQAALQELQTERPSVAVLCRRTSLMQPILQALRDAGVSAEIAGAQGLLFQSAAVDLRAALKVATNPGDSPALLRLLTRLDIGTRDLWQLGKLATSIVRSGDAPHPPPLLAEALENVEQADLSRAAVLRLSRLRAQLKEMRDASGWPVSDQVGNARRILELDQQAAAIGEERQVGEVLDTLQSLAASYQNSSAFPTMEGFLDWLDAAEEKERGLQLPATKADPGSVQVMTVHASKGLEWDAVAVVDLELPVFPSKRGGRGSRKVKLDILPPLLRKGAQPQKGWWKKLGQLPYPARRDAAHLPDPDVWAEALSGAKASEVTGLFESEIGRYLQREDRRLAYVAFTRARFRLGLFGSWLGDGVTPRFPSMFITESQEVDGVDAQIDSLPSEQEIAQAHSPALGVQFPPQPSALKKSLREVAARVKIEMDEPTVTPDAALAQLPSEMRKTLRGLLEENRAAQLFKALDAESKAALEIRDALGDDLRLPTTALRGILNTEDIWSELRRPLPTEPSDGATLGSAFHLWAENRLRTVSAGVSTEDTESFTLPALPGVQQEKLSRLQRAFESLPWTNQVVPSALETPFSIRVGAVLLRGRIDAVLDHAPTGEQWVVDWKSERLPDYSKDSGTMEQNLIQLSAYREAWERRSGSKPLAKLVFLGGKEPVEVTLAQLEKLYEDTTGTTWSLESMANRAAERLFATGR